MFINNIKEENMIKCEVIERFDLKRETHPKKKYLCTLFITVPL